MQVAGRKIPKASAYSLMLLKFSRFYLQGRSISNRWKVVPVMMAGEGTYSLEEMLTEKINITRASIDKMFFIFFGNS